MIKSRKTLVVVLWSTRLTADLEVLGLTPATSELLTIVLCRRIQNEIKSSVGLEKLLKKVCEQKLLIRIPKLNLEADNSERADHLPMRSLFDQFQFSQNKIYAIKTYCLLCLVALTLFHKLYEEAFIRFLLERTWPLSNWNSLLYLKSDGDRTRDLTELAVTLTQKSPTYISYLSLSLI